MPTQRPDLYEPLVLAGFRLAAIAIAAQQRAGALSQSEREDSAEILSCLADDLEAIAADGDFAREALTNVRELAGHLAARRAPER